MSGPFFILYFTCVLKYAFLYLFAVSFPFASLAQEITNIGTNDGLGHPTVYATAQDPYGLVWLATRDGLYRFNEGRVVPAPFEHHFPASQSSNVQSLLVTSDSLLVLGLQRGGVSIVDLAQQRVMFFDEYPTLRTNSPVSALYEGPDGALWAGTEGDGLYRWNRQNNQWRRMDAALGSSAFHFVFDFERFNDTLWIATSGNNVGYYLSERDELGVIKGRGNELDSYRKMLVTWNRRLYVGAENKGAFIWNNGQLDRLDAPITTVRDLEVHPQTGDLWVSTDGNGLWRNNGRDWRQWTKLDPRAGLKTNQFYNFTPVDGRLWLGSFNAGAFIIDEQPGAVRRWDELDEFAINSFQSALVLHPAHGGIYVGYDGDGLVFYPDNGDPPKRPGGLQENGPRVITSLCTDRFGQLWIGTYNEGIYVLDAEQHTKHHFEAFTPGARGLGNNNIWSLATGLGDTLWIGTLGGLQFWDGQNFSYVGEEPFAFGRNIMDLATQPNGDLLVATEFRGVFQLHRDIEQAHLPVSTAVLDVLSLDTAVIIATEGSGLYYWDGIRTDTLLDPATYTTVYSAVKWGNGIVLGTNEGLINLTQRNGAWSWEHLATVEDLGITLFNRKSLCATDRGMLVGGVNGFVQVSVANLPIKHSEHLLLTSVVTEKGERLLPPTSSNDDILHLAFEAGLNRIEWHFEVVALSFSRTVALEYSLDGSAWSPWPSNSRNLLLSSVDPGAHRAQLRLRDSEGTVLDELSFTFDIAFFFWQTLWFQVGIGLLVLVVVGVGAYLLQDRRLKATRVQLLEAEGELLALRAKELEAESRKKSEELNFQLLKTSSRIEILKQLKERIIALGKKRGKQDADGVFRELLGTINSELQSENYWEKFERNYKEVHAQFSEELQRRFSKLTKGDIRLAYLVHEKMTNKEMATVLNVSPAAVEKAKYRLKKKLDLDKEDSLDDFIQSL